MTLVRNKPPRPTYAATFVDASHPMEMTSGERAVAYLDYRNNDATE